VDYNTKMGPYFSLPETNIQLSSGENYQPSTVVRSVVTRNYIDFGIYSNKKLNLTEIVVYKNIIYPLDLTSYSNSYQVRHSDGRLEDVYLEPQVLLDLYTQTGFEQLLTPESQIRSDRYLSFILRCQSDIQQMSWVIYDTSLQVVNERDFRQNFPLAVMQLLCDLAEMTPLVIEHNIPETDEPNSLDLKKLDRFFPKHPILNRQYLPDNSPYPVISQDERYLNLSCLISVWTDRHRANPPDALQDAKDLFEVFWRSLINHSEAESAKWCQGIINRSGRVRRCQNYRVYGKYCPTHSIV